MSDQLPVINKSHAVNATATQVSSLLGRGLVAIQSRKLIIETKLLDCYVRIMDLAFRMGYYTFKENARFCLDQVRIRVGDEVVKMVTLDNLKKAYIRLPDSYINQRTSFKEVELFQTIDELYLDDELLKDGITLGGYHIEAGVKKYDDFSQVMIKELGEHIRPYLRLIYESVKYYPGFDNTGMDADETIEQIATANHSNTGSQYV